MEQLQQLFKLKISPLRLEAEILCNDTFDGNWSGLELTIDNIKAYLESYQITFGHIYENIRALANNPDQVMFPLLVARGIDKEDGKDGEIKYFYDTTTEVDRSEGWDFREVMRIPTVNNGDKLATLIAPTKGKNGRTIYDKVLPAKPGKPYHIRAGKNVEFKEHDQSFYATADGQVSFGHKVIHVYNVYEVNEDISMKIGNIDFLGNVVIKGDVPTGFTVKATGDIKIFGLVEAATIIAGGSVFISEGMAGLKIGVIEAGENVHIGYINQGNVEAGNSIYADHSILHSQCAAVNDITCKQGNIIGGVSSAGHSILAKDIGNRMNTSTELSFGVDKNLFSKQQELEKEKETLQDNLRKLSLLRDKLNREQNPTSKTRVTMLKLRHSVNQTEEKLRDIEERQQGLNSNLGAIEDCFLKVKGTIFPNTSVSFGKYRRTIDKNYDQAFIKMANNEITIQ